MTALILFSVCKSLTEETALQSAVKKLSWQHYCIGIAIILLWVLSSGIGASVIQYPDHLYRNGIFKVLVDESWPVRTVVSSGTERGLAYYIGFWLPSALFAKATSYSGGLLFMQVWAVFGIFLIWRFLCEKQGEARLWFLAIMIFFGGLDVIGRRLTGSLYTQPGNSYEWWAIFFNYPGNSSHLFWAYNQVIYGWLIYCMICRQRTNKGILLIWSSALISCTFPAIGLIPFAVFRGIENGEGESLRKKLISGLKESCSVQNVVGFAVSIILILYLLPNDTVMVNLQHTAATEPSGVLISTVADQTVITGLNSMSESFRAWPWTTKLWMYLWFILLEIGVYYLLIAPSAQKKPVFWLSFCTLLIIPWIKVGYYIDFCERAAIPALLCLMELVISALREYKEKKKYVLMAGLILVLLAGSVTTFDTIGASMGQTAQVVDNLVGEGQDVIPQKVSNETIMNDGTFSTNANSFFYEYLAKKGDTP